MFSKSIGLYKNDILYLENVFNSPKTNTRFYRTNMNKPNQVPESIGNLPKLSNNYPNISKENQQLAIANARLVNKNEIVAIAYNNIPLFEIYNLETNKKTAVSGPDKLPPNEKFGELFYYSYPYISERYIYISYIENRDVAEYNTSTILVFSHDGKPVKKIQLDHSTFSIAVLDDEYLYTLSEHVNSKDYAILKYKLHN